MNATAYAPPTNVLGVLQNIEYEQPLVSGDPRFVDTQAARGSEKTFSRLAKKLGLDQATGNLYAPSSKHVLFFGHIGSGKTTELRHYAANLDKSDRFLVVEVDVVQNLDPHNLQYADTLMSLAEKLVQTVENKGLTVNGSALVELQKWFSERVIEHADAKELSAQLDTGAKAKGGIPFLLDFFAKFTASMKASASYKESLRTVIRNNFAQLKDHFNRLIRETEEALKNVDGRERRVLFVVDGTDKLRSEDTQRFFVEDAEQLLAIDALVVYTAPIHLKYSGRLAGKLDTDLVLPMIRLADSKGTRCMEGYRAMREILLLRADIKLFATEAEIEQLVDSSGGHPRELLRLLHIACELADNNRIDGPTVQTAIKKLASEYRYLLDKDDYAELVRIDRDPDYALSNERIQRLLSNLALMQYNDGSWQHSHPVVRQLEGYKRAFAAPPP